MNSIVVGGSFNIANDTKSDGEAIAITHQGQLQLQGVVFAVGIMYKNIIKGIAVLADFDDFQAKALLYESELIILTKDELLTMTDVDGVLLTTLVVIDGLMTTIVKDDAVLQYLSD